MPTKASITLADITRDTPLRLDVAARLAFPDGSMSVSGLRSEITKGRLECERIAGKQYVTLAAIEAMRIKCREKPKALAFTSETAAPSGLSSTEQSKSALAAAQMIAERLKKPSPNTLAKSTDPNGTTVIPLRYS